MKLRFSPTSPFVRKVRLSAHELGLQDRIELVPTDAWSPETDLATDNPLGKVPTLIFDDGRSLAESGLICEYLDELAGGSLFPKTPDRWDIMRRYAVADGMITATVARLIEQFRRPKEVQWQGWVDRQSTNIQRSLKFLEAECPRFKTPWTIAEIATICGLSYLDFRSPDDDWRTPHPTLAAWYDDAKQRPSAVATELKMPS